ncbi:hypothetical protein SAMN05216570_1500 [Dyella sp. OK004]|uniref:DUF1684 domain-containing protein n=1 Tax=Dyella sp. OK004 TaxID=1855292 RepID=UPI0008F0B484|nr:DUF1684 domain-containing protein [Dyella sp. OK004]SFS01210.1 hypothetical protein SAMN05216570_1500 [Dyella sp. OK004]
MRRSMLRFTCCTVFAALSFAALPFIPVHAAEVGGDYAKQVASARAARVEALQRPDGYLSLVGSCWLEPGDNTVGAAADNHFPVPGAPAHLGVLHLAADGTVSLRTVDGVTVTVDGKSATASPMSTQGAQEKHTPTRAYFGPERYLYVVETGARRGLRVKDNAAPLRTHFPGFNYFPVDPSWKIEAQWQPFETPHTLKLVNVAGAESDEPVAGQAVFERDGKRYTLIPMEEDGRLFFVLSDRTAGKLTYGGARFLYAAMPKDGKVVLDFNLAENPPCAITPHVVCPLAPPENRLGVAITAGEKKFEGAGH